MVYLLKMVDLSIAIDGLPIQNGDFPIEIDGLPMKNGGSFHRNRWFTY